MTIAVDFDGVLCKDEWPKIGDENQTIITRLIRMRERGDKVILWTCRTGDKLGEAVEWCRKRGLVFDAVNANLPEHIAEYGNDCRKVFADFYWDDKAVVIKTVSNGMYIQGRWSRDYEKENKRSNLRTRLRFLFTGRM